MTKRKAATASSPQATKRAAGAISNGDGAGGDSRVQLLQFNRSDGTEVWQEGDNGPTPDMFDDSPDEKGGQCYMRSIERYEKKGLEWLKFLAEGVLMEASTDEAHKKAFKEGTKFFFVALPKGYRLFEQIKITVGLRSVGGEQC